MNGYDPRIDYDVEEVWFPSYIPAEMPEEGTSIEMGCKLPCEREMFRLNFMVQLHINANGVTTAEVIRP